MIIFYHYFYSSNTTNTLIRKKKLYDDYNQFINIYEDDSLPFGGLKNYILFKLFQ